MAAPQNPFIIRQLAAGAHFADREREVARMASALDDPGGGLVVFGYRRLGKSSALERAAQEVRAGGGRAVVASLATATDAADAARRVLEAVQRQVGRSWREILDGVVRRARASMEIQPASLPHELPSIRFEFGSRDPGDSVRLLPEVLSAVDAEMQRRGRVLGVGLDEFQRIHEWGGEDAEWALREAMQRHRSLGYVLAGSARGLIQAMVGERGRAFWKLFDPLEFGPIAPEVLAEWIHGQAARTGLRAPLAAAERVVQLAWPRTRDVVQLARELWSRMQRAGAVRPQDVDETFETIVDAQASLYQKLWSELAATQQRVLRVVALDPSLPLTAAETLQRFHLGPKSTAHRAAEALLASEHLVSDGGRYRFDDPYFGRWVQRYTLADLGYPAPALPPAP